MGKLIVLATFKCGHLKVPPGVTVGVVDADLIRQYAAMRICPDCTRAEIHRRGKEIQEEGERRGYRDPWDDGMWPD